MITEIEIEGFKSLEKVHLELGGFNLFIGANASGKSNFFDALRVLQGIGYGFTIDEIFNGKPKGAASEVWEGIRGGTGSALFTGREQEREQLGLSLVVGRGLDSCRFSMVVNPRFSFLELEVKDRSGNLIWENRSSPGELTLHDPWRENDQIRASLVRHLSNAQQLKPSLDLLRDYSLSRSVKRIGERGENFAALVQTILEKPDLASAYVSWLRQLTPKELDEVEILRGALGEPLFAVKEDGHVRPAPILSDGTLRFAALAAAFFQPDMPDILTIEEIENGIHPSRLRLLVELLKSQSAAGTPGGPQVFATTHSPIVLAWLEESDYETTFLCRRDEETGASIIKPISEIPFLIEVVRKQPISELFAEGWLEGAF